MISKSCLRDLGNTRGLKWIPTIFWFICSSPFQLILLHIFEASKIRFIWKFRNRKNKTYAEKQFLLFHGMKRDWSDITSQRWVGFRCEKSFEMALVLHVMTKGFLKSNLGASDLVGENIPFSPTWNFLSGIRTTWPSRMLGLWVEGPS